MPRPEITVASLYFYPVKSCAGINLEEATIDSRGIKDDRGWLVVDQNYKFITQRESSKLALIKATVSQSSDSVRELKLEAPGMAPLMVQERTRPDPHCGHASHAVKIWNGDAQGIDQGVEAAQWLSQYLGRKAHLLRKRADDIRDVKSERHDAPRAEVNFQDGYPFLIISQASLDDLNSKLQKPLPMNRFRPNIVLQGAQAFGEDNWLTIKIGDLIFEFDAGCPRCTITTIDQETAAKGVEPLKTLATFRQQDNKIMFGQNAIHTSSGIIRINDKVEVIKSFSPK